MERKMKYITFPVKKCTTVYKGRTCSPFDYPKYKKCTVSVRKVLCKYKKIVSKNCRINDMSKLINSDLLFPMNRSEYTNLLLELLKKSTRFFASFSMLSHINEISIFRFVYYSIRSNCQVIVALLYSETENKYLFNIKKQVKILKLNFITSNEILKCTNDLAKNWKITNIMKILETYLSHLRTICTFIYLMIFKKKSRVINRLLPPVSHKSSNIYICGLCHQPEVTCMCFADIESTFNRNHDYDDDDYFSSESVNNLRDDKTGLLLFIQYLSNINYIFGFILENAFRSLNFPETKKSKRDSEESSTDTD